MSLTEQRTAIQAELERAKRAAKEKRAEMDKAMESAKSEGVNFATDGAAFDKFHEDYSRPYGEAKEAVISLQDRLSKVLDVEGGDAPDPKSNGPQATEPAGELRNAAKDIVSRFVQSPEYKAALPAVRAWEPGERLQTTPVEIMSRDEASAMIEQKTLVTGASATSGGPFVINDVLPGLTLTRPFWPNRVTDLVGKGQTNSDTVEYVSQTSRTNNAAETAEATSGSDGALPESAVAFATVTVPVQLFGHFIPATSRVLEDEAQMGTILREELVSGVLNRLNSQILNGDGNAPNISGILTDVSQAQALGADSRSDAIHKAITQIRIHANVNDSFQPNGVVLHPSDYQDIVLEKDANGRYLYGDPNMPGSRTVWGLPLVQDTAIAAGTGLVGAFDQGARLWMRRGVTLSITDSHSDFFIREILVLKVTMRLAFKTIRIGAFTKVTGI